MTIGPEPMTRMRWMSARRGMNQIVDDVVARPAGSPTSSAPKLAVAANEHGHVHRTCQCWIGSNVGGDAEPVQDGGRERTNTRAVPAAHVVHLARRASLEQEEIRLNDV